MTGSGPQLLSFLIWLPIVGGGLVLAVAADDSRAALAHRLSLGIAVAVFLLSLPLYTGFDKTTAAMQFVERVSWIATFNVYYHLGVDGISVPLILLTSFLTPVVVIAGWEVIEE